MAEQNEATNGEAEAGIVGEPASSGTGDFAPTPLVELIAVGPDGKRYQLSGQVTLVALPDPIET